MTSNREWLYGMDVADLAEWFDAEHEDVESDEWKAKAEGSSKVRIGQSNLEWLLEHDRKAVADFLDCAVKMCNNCAYDKYRIDDKCPSGSEWLMAPHDCGQNADMSKKTADCVRSELETSEIDDCLVLARARESGKTMADNRTTELREKLDKLGIEHLDSDLPNNKQTRWNKGAGGWDACYVEITNGSILPTDSIVDIHTLRIYDCTPEQAIAATLGSETCEVREEQGA